MHRTLIVARLRQQSAPQVAHLFADSDTSDLPHTAGVSRRTLFTFHDLYFHLIETNHDTQPNLTQIRNHPLYQDIETRLRKFISPYDPNWQEPTDAIAHPFYEWTADQGRIK